MTTSTTMNDNADNDEHKAFESDEILEDDYDDDADDEDADEDNNDNENDDDNNFINSYTDG